jgi:hypothetical protein
MDTMTVLTICAVVFTAAVVAVSVFLMRALLQVRRTAAQAEAVLHRAAPLVAEAELAVREYRGLGHQLTETAGKENRLAAQIEGVGSKALGATDIVLSGVGGPLGRVMAIWSGVKTGLQVFRSLAGRRRSRGGRE